MPTARRSATSSSTAWAYVEFKLDHTTGTRYGLQWAGASIRCWLDAPLAAWRYDWHAEPDSPEAKSWSTTLRPRDWIGESREDRLTHLRASD